VLDHLHMTKQCDLLVIPVETQLTARRSEACESKAGSTRSFCGLGYAGR